MLLIVVILSQFYATSKRARRWHPIKRRLNDLAIQGALHSILPDHLDLVPNNPHSHFLYDRVGPLEQPLRILAIIEVGL